MDDLQLTGNHASETTSGHDAPVTSPVTTELAAELSCQAHWVRALLVRQGYGVRSDCASGSVHLVCDTGMYSLDAALQERDVNGWFVIGQLFLRRNNAPAESIEVTLHVDEKPVVSATTDAFGEFSFPSKAGRRIGVALNGPELAHVELWRVD